MNKDFVSGSLQTLKERASAKSQMIKDDTKLMMTQN